MNYILIILNPLCSLCAMWKMLLRLYEKWIPSTAHRFVQHCIALNLYHGVPWCWLQHIIYVVSTLIKVFVINCGVLCSSINCRVAPIKHSEHFKSHYFVCLSYLVMCSSLHCRAVCWFRSAMCKNVRTAPTWRAAESGRNSVLYKVWWSYTSKFLSRPDPKSPELQTPWH